ncbi:MAG: Rrf2 family transcriptional regulator [Proteobacteria bacterium]|nr:Rrf2 family transcriptional regulator [Pseudomonadota bacterium]
MKISSKARSSITAMVELVKRMEFVRYIPLSYLAEKDGLSLVLLEQLFSKLRKSGLVMSHRGLSGGYALTRSPQDISIYDIIQSVDPITDAMLCKGNVEGCKLTGTECSTHHLWYSFDVLTQSFFKSVTLYDVVYNKGVLERHEKGGIS